MAVGHAAVEWEDLAIVCAVKENGLMTAAATAIDYAVDVVDEMDLVDMEPGHQVTWFRR